MLNKVFIKASVLLKQLKSSIRSQTYIQRLINMWQQLDFTKKCYLLAILLLCFGLFNISAIVTIIGLVIEYWPKFVSLWNTLIGKAIILFFYAALANFALAFSAIIVNEVTGVSASEFLYTHNFSLILYLPVLMVLISLTMLLVVIFIVMIAILLMLLLKPFHYVGMNFLNQPYFIRLTIIKTILLINILFMFNESEHEALLTINYSGLVTSQSIDDKEIEITDNSENDKTDIVDNGIKDSYLHWVKRLVANFAYQYEGDSYSRCQKSDNSSVVELNDFEILEIVPDDTQPYGYLFSVKMCHSAAFPLTL